MVEQRRNTFRTVGKRFQHEDRKVSDDISELLRLIPQEEAKPNTIPGSAIKTGTIDLSKIMNSEKLDVSIPFNLRRDNDASFFNLFVTDVPADTAVGCRVAAVGRQVGSDIARYKEIYALFTDTATTTYPSTTIVDLQHGTPTFDLQFDPPTNSRDIVIEASGVASQLVLWSGRITFIHAKED